ncbi:MAG: lysylphosphatidylglycerol synthase domain-containing protein, partial [Candidatus Latescibacterota bacterium]|nr:lysylphosphatidylglycerol synthase domain-containing protein [Candidatus Latescibacterota bacterium]
ISLFYREHKLRFFLVLLFHTLGWMLGVCETFVILESLNTGVGFDIAFLITSLAVVINSLFFFMPSNIGVLEGGQVFLFLTLGLDPATGLSLGIIKRMRKIFWIGLGWLFLAQLSRSFQSMTAFPSTDDPTMGVVSHGEAS